MKVCKPNMSAPLLFQLVTNCKNAALLLSTGRHQSPYLRWTCQILYGQSASYYQ
jgi:hypothetical protein